LDCTSTEVNLTLDLTPVFAVPVLPRGGGAGPRGFNGPGPAVLGVTVDVMTLTGVTGCAAGRVNIAGELKVCGSVADMLTVGASVALTGVTVDVIALTGGLSVSVIELGGVPVLTGVTGARLKMRSK
jgi:hypothetical protein